MHGFKSKSHMYFLTILGIEDDSGGLLLDRLINNFNNTLVDDLGNAMCAGANTGICLVDDVQNPIINDSGNRVCLGSAGRAVHRNLLNSTGGPLRNNNKDYIIKG